MGGHRRTAVGAGLRHLNNRIRRSSSTKMPLALQCKVCHLSNAKSMIPFYTSHYNRQWGHQLRCLAQLTQETSSSSSIADSDINPADAEFEPSSSSDTTNNSLHGNIHYILKRVPIGKLTKDELSKARAFLSITSKWQNEQGATLSEALLDRLYKEQQSASRRRSYSSIEVVVDAQMYNVCLDAWNKSGASGETIVSHVESILERMEERYARAQLNESDYPQLGIARPDSYGYNCLINAYSKWDEDCSHKVEAILEKMDSLAKEAALSDNVADQEYASRVRPDTYTYNSLMNYHATRKNQYVSAQRAEELLLKMSELSKQRGNSIQMDVTSFNTALKAWSNCGGGITGAQRAEMDRWRKRMQVLPCKRLWSSWMSWKGSTSLKGE